MIFSGYWFAGRVQAFLIEKRQHFRSVFPLAGKFGHALLENFSPFFPKSMLAGTTSVPPGNFLLLGGRDFLNSPLLV